MKRLTLLLTCFFISMGLAIAQNKQVTGTVVDESGESVIGASVVAKGTTIGTVTDVNGKFSVSIPETVNVLVVRYIGYAETEAIAGTDVSIVLMHDAEVLNEVVIVGPMGILRPARSAGFGQSLIDPGEAVQRAEPDLFRSLSGKVPGVQINSSSSAPGSATKIVIRGNSSFLGSNDPLYVVDGVPYSNPEVVTGDRLVNAGAYGTGISTLDPNDIESMDILKGASAAALYGSRAANGVVLITTKAGSKKTRPSQKKSEVTFTSSYALENIASLPTYQNTYGQGSNFMYSNSNGSWGPAFGTLETIPTYPSYLAAFPEMGETIPYQAYPNNVKDLFRQGWLFDNSVNVQSYNDKGNFSTTVSNVTQDGFIPDSGFGRTSFSVGGNQKLDNGVTVGGTLSYSRTTQDGPFFGAGNYGGSISSFSRTLLMPRNIDAAGLPYESPDGAMLFPFSVGSVDNPLWSWKNNTNQSIQDRTVTTVNAGYDFTKWLSAFYQFGWNQYEVDRKAVINRGSVGPNGYVGLGRITNEDYKTQELESNFNITLKHKFAEDFNVRAVLGHSVNQRATVNTFTEGNIMILPDIYNIDNTQQQTAEEYHTKRRLWALYADVLLSYKTYAFMTLTMRNDHSSTLPVKYNSYYYPSVSGSFVFTDAFELDPKILTFGKIRAGWGRVGNDASPYYVDGTYRQSTPPFSERALMYMPTTIYDPELKPEMKSDFEVGTELMFFQDRIGIDFTWYHSVASDQIGTMALPRSTGSSAYVTNFGEMTNKGVELGLTLVPVNLKNSFKWSIAAVYSKNISNVVSLRDGIDKIEITGTNSSSEVKPMLIPGSPYGVLWGSVIIRDEDGTPLVNPSTGAYMEAPDLAELGDPYPSYKGAITNTFSYKGVWLSAMFDARVGGVLVSGPASDMLGRGVTKDTEDRLGTRILPGVLGGYNANGDFVALKDASGNKIPNTIQLSENDLWFASSGTAPTFAMNSVDEFTTFDATVFRLSEVTLGYDLPEQWLRKTFLGSASFSIVARNLWYYAPGFPKYTNYDPGSNSFGVGNIQGIDRETAPTTRRIGFNVKLTF